MGTLSESFHFAFKLSTLCRQLDLGVETRQGRIRLSELPVLRRRGGRPRPPVDMNEGWRNGPPGRRPLRMRSRQAVHGPRDVEDAVPYGMTQISGVVRRPREGQAPPLRGGGGRTWCENRARVRICGTSRTPSPTGQRKNGISRRKIPFSYTVSYTVILPRFSYSFQAATCSRSHRANSSMPSPVRAQMGMIFMLGLRRRTYSRHLSRSKSK